MSKSTISVASPKRSGKDKQQLERRRNQTSSSSDHFINPLWYHEDQEIQTRLEVVGTQANETEEKVRGRDQDEGGQTSEATIAMIDVTTGGDGRKHS